MKPVLEAAERGLLFFKAAMYLYFFVVVYANFVGPVEVGNWFNIDKPTENGIKLGELVISTQIVQVTMGLALLEFSSNLVSFWKSFFE